MKIVNRKELMSQPDHTLYSVFKPHYFEGLFIFGGGELQSDFVSADLIGNIDAADFAEMSDLIDAAIDNGTSFKLDFEGWGRDGLFEREDMYAIYEKDDLEGLKHVVERALANYEVKESE